MHGESKSLSKRRLQKIIGLRPGYKLPNKKNSEKNSRYFGPQLFFSNSNIGGCFLLTQG